MTDTEFLALAGTIWVAPHTHPMVGMALGLGYITIAVCSRLGCI